MAKLTKKYGTIRVQTKNEPLVLSFGNQEAYQDALRELVMADRVIIDAFWGYALYQTAEAALAVAKIYD